MSPSSRASRCRGPHPVRAQAEPEASRAEKNACETKGLYAVFALLPELPAGTGEAAVGLAHASQSAAGISLTDGTASSVFSEESIDYLNRSQVGISDPRISRRRMRTWWHKVTDANIVHWDGDFKGKGFHASLTPGAKTLQRSSGLHNAPPARAAPVCAQSTPEAASRINCARSRARVPAAHRPNRRRNAAGCGTHGEDASCLFAGQARPPATPLRRSCARQLSRAAARALLRATPAPDPDQTTSRPRVRNRRPVPRPSVSPAYGRH